jgi:hypothetical protein
MYTTLNKFCEAKNINKKTLWGRLSKTDIKPINKVWNEHIYLIKDLNKLLVKKENNIVYITEVYHIYESKMNYDQTI